jgi:hypoxanthine phosphoribosyltransferase
MEPMKDIYRIKYGDNKYHVGYEEFVDRFDKLCDIFRDNINEFSSIEGFYGIPRGGTIIAMMLSYRFPELQLHLTLNNLSPDTLVIDDICDTGQTLSVFAKHDYKTAVIFLKPHAKMEPTYWAALADNDRYYEFPYEK